MILNILLKNYKKLNLSILLILTLVTFVVNSCGQVENTEPDIEVVEESLSTKRDTSIHWITNWPGTGNLCKHYQNQQGDIVAPIEYFDEMSKYWQNQMKSEGWRKNKNYGNDNVWSSDFIEDELISGGKDHKYFDVSQAAVITTHGGADDHTWYGALRKDTDGFGCYITSENMRLGEPAGGIYGKNPGKLDFMHLVSCNSANENKRFNHWENAFQGIHFITGFNNVTRVSWWNNDDLEEFAYWAHDQRFSRWIGGGTWWKANEMSYEWLDNMLHWNWIGDDDTCPVAMTVGKDKNDALKRLYNEKYKNNNFTDLKYSDWYAFYSRYWKYCTPG